MSKLSSDYFEQISGMLDNHRGLPSALYSDTDWFDLEKKAIFARRWYYIGPVQKISRPGEVLLGFADNVPVVVTRDRAGTLHALVNICRHRAHPVCRSEGKVSALVCPYHAWTYNMDGSLRGAPGSETDPAFDKADFALARLPVFVWGSLVFVAPREDVPELYELMPTFREVTERRGIVLDPDQYVHYQRYELEMRTNWKLYYDNALECYHCPTTHSGTFNDVYSTQNDYETHVDRWLVSYYFPPKTPKPGQDLQITFNRHVHVVPGFFCHQQDDIMIAYQMRALSPTRTRVHWDIFTDASGDASKVERWADLWFRTLSEDKEAVEAIQLNMETRLFDANRFIQAREPALIDHSRWILEDCKAEFERRS